MRDFVSRPDTAWVGSGTAFAVCWWLDPPVLRWSNWASRRSRAWAGSGIRPAAPTRRVLVPGWAVGMLALAYGTRVEDAQENWQSRTPPKACPVLDTGALAPTHRDRVSRPDGTVSVIRYGIDWLRRLLLEVASGAASGCCLNPGPNPSPTWKSPAMRLPLTYPCQPLVGEGRGEGYSLPQDSSLSHTFTLTLTLSHQGRGDFL